MRGTPGDEPQPRMVKRFVPGAGSLIGYAATNCGLGTLLKSRKKFSVVCCQVPSIAASQIIGQNRCSISGVGRFVAFAAIGDGRQIRRVGFDQYAITGHVSGYVSDILTVFESQDAGEGNIQAKLDTALCQSATGRKTMQNSGEGTFPRLFSQNRHHVLIGASGVDDKRQSAFAGGSYVFAEAPFLSVPGRFIIVIVQSGFANRHDTFVACEIEQLFDRYIEFFISVMRMGANGTKYVVETFGDRKHLRKFLHAGADGDHTADATIPRASDNIVEFIAKSGKSRWQ